MLWGSEGNCCWFWLLRKLKNFDKTLQFCDQIHCHGKLFHVSAWIDGVDAGTVRLRRKKLTGHEYLG